MILKTSNKNFLLEFIFTIVKGNAQVNENRQIWPSKKWNFIIIIF